MGALLDELACLTRDLMVLQTAPREGISLLSSVASDTDVKALVQRFSPAELVYMMNMIQKTLASFTRSASRRMDTELCLVNLCQPELLLDAQNLNARLGRVEEQLRSGVALRAAAPAPTPAHDDEELPPLPDDSDAPPDFSQMEEAPKAAPPEPPAAFWTELASQVRSELKPPVSGFFAPTPNAPVQGVLKGDVLELRCANSFTVDVVNKPEILALVGRKAAAFLGRNVMVKAVDKNSIAASAGPMADLLNFGKAHSDIVRIKKS
jgi:DNA polymerase III gamma/tau subunit